MKSKINSPAILLAVTGALFISGIFLVGLQARQQIQNTGESLDAFIEQVENRQQELTDAQDSFSAAVKEKKDLLNYQQKKAAGKQVAVQEHRDTADTTADSPVSVFSQDYD